MAIFIVYHFCARRYYEGFVCSYAGICKIVAALFFNDS